MFGNKLFVTSITPFLFPIFFFNNFCRYVKFSKKLTKLYTECQICLKWLAVFKKGFFWFWKLINDSYHIISVSIILPLKYGMKSKGYAKNTYKKQLLHFSKTLLIGLFQFESLFKNLKMYQFTLTLKPIWVDKAVLFPCQSFVYANLEKLS